jgi:hypothetical protein
MYVVPIKGDLIKTIDGAEFTVAEYTNFKSRGPAVYVEQESSSNALAIYFFDIEELNGIKVTYNSSTKILSALGHFKRKQHLPQKHDIITTEDTKTFKVSDLKLHNRKYGLSHGLLIIGSDDEVYSLKDIVAIKRSFGDSFFDKKQFQKTYSDYLGSSKG